MKESKEKIKVTRKIEEKEKEFYIIGKTSFKVERVINKDSNNDFKSLLRIYLREQELIK